MEDFHIISQSVFKLMLTLLSFGAVGANWTRSGTIEPSRRSHVGEQALFVTKFNLILPWRKPLGFP